MKVHISLNLKPEFFFNIETAGGMVANAGKNKQVTFTVMPEKAGELNIKADVVDFRITGHGNSCCSTIDVDRCTRYG